MSSKAFIDIVDGLDHGTLANIVGDNRLIEVVQRIAQSREVKGTVNRGQLILDILGGPQAILDHSDKRNPLLLSLSSKERNELASGLKVSTLEDFRLTSARRKALFEWFKVPLPDDLVADRRQAVELIKPGYELYPHQSDALFKSSDYLESTEPRVMLHMPTGSGKTRTAMHLVCRHLNNRSNGVVVWLVPGKELCEQAEEEFKKAWGYLGERALPLITAWDSRRGCDLDSFHQNSRNVSSSSFTKTYWPEELNDGMIIGSIDTIRMLQNNWQPREFARRASNISLIVFDEAHRSVARTYANTINALLTGRRAGLLGLSATPGRSHYGSDDDQNSELVSLFKGQKVQLDIIGYSSPVEALIVQGYLAKLTKERLNIVNDTIPKRDLFRINAELENKLDLPQETLRTLGLDVTRNMQIVKCVEEIVKDKNHMRVIVFNPSVESSRLIASILSTLGIPSFSVSSETDKVLRENILTDFKRKSTRPMVLCNYGVLTTGFDAPKTSAVVIARPTLSVVLLNQMAGRAIRGEKIGGNKEALLVTVVDTSIPQLVDTVNQFHAFDNAWDSPNNQKP